MPTPPPDFYTQAMTIINYYGLPLLVFSIVTGAILGWLVHYFVNVRPINRAIQIEKQIAEKDSTENNEKSLIKTDEEVKEMLMKGQGRINNTHIKKNRVAFNPNVEERAESLITTTECEESDSEETELEEEQMPQINDRKVTNAQTKQVKLSIDDDRPLDSDRISKTLGKLHGKLATAQLKAKTKRMEAEMSAEERDYERQMKAKQMESIMALMMQNKEKFGMDNEDDIKEQLNLYNF